MTTLVKVAWCDEAERAFISSGAAGDDIEQIRHEVITDQAGLYHLPECGGKWPGFLVLRTEELANGRRELVAVAICGGNIAGLVETVKAVSGRHGATSIRFHSKRPGVGRLLARHGFKERERVYSWGA